ncbi:MAG: hypothetical protein M1838_002977 [Thelocarpon superellum]|nr:MAG: hypothetical protein M1838_002977 [Thelocarpon superellum]
MVIALVIFIFYYTSDSRQARSNDFRSKTLVRMEEKAANAKSDDLAKKMAERLKAAEQDMKANLPNAPEHVLSDEKPTAEDPKSVAGRKKMGVAQDGKDASKQGKAKVVSEEEHRVEEELNSILKRSPIIIFSKTYCPHSKRAKAILLEKYKIVPPPYVAELDTHPLGPGLQDALEKTTGRRTVPNVLVSGRSIGGGDDVAKLDADGELVAKIKKMAGKRIMEARLASPA